MSTQRVTDSPDRMQATVAKLTRDQLHLLCRAGMLAADRGLLETWSEADRDSLRTALLESLTAVQRDFARHDEVIGLQLGNAVLHATRTKSTAFAGHTVGSFIDGLLQVLHRDDELAAIEFGDNGSRRIVVDRDELGAVEIREMRRSGL